MESYDLILGMDWLELYSPMQIHWQARWLSFLYQGEHIMLQRITIDVEPELIF